MDVQTKDQSRDDNSPGGDARDAQPGTQGTQGGADDGKGGGGDADDIEIDGDKVDPEKLKKLITANRALRKEKLDTRSELEKVRAENEKYLAEEQKRREAEMSEAEKAAARAEKAEKEAQELREQAAAKDRLMYCQDAGVEPKYRSYIQEELHRAAEKEPELLTNEEKRSKWFEEHRKENPAFYGEAGGTAGTVQTAGGHQRQGGVNPESQIAKLEKELAEKKKMGLLTVGQEAVLLSRIEVLRSQASA